MQFQNLASRNIMNMFLTVLKYILLNHIVSKHFVSTPMGTILFCRLILFGTEICFYSKTSYLPKKMFFLECRKTIDLRINTIYIVNVYENDNKKFLKKLLKKSIKPTFIMLIAIVII